MSYDFDRIIDRRTRNSTKWLAAENQATSAGQPPLPLSIADMDFSSPPAVAHALQDLVTHGVFGYTEYAGMVIDPLCDWLAARHRWQIKPEWVVPCCSVESAMDAVIHTLTEPQDDIVILSPGFGAFAQVIEQTGRNIIEVALDEGERNYTLDFRRLESRLSAKTRLMILCNPHNPIGKVWRADELTAIGEICQRHNLLLLSDDVHQDLILGDVPYTPLAGLNDQFADLAVTFTSPEKTFNLAGLQIANLIISNASIREKIAHALRQRMVHKPNMFALYGGDAAYRYGAQWLDALINYLKMNYILLQQGVDSIADVELFENQGSYLAWLDFRKSGLSQPELARRLRHEAGLLLESGLHFGSQGAGFMRLNFALPRAQLAVAIRNLQRCFAR
ncbi:MULTISPECIES: MalY/PatB family protein [Brenneria]|uniref:cysteine-S-conjugate beta-lyase n=1 Tax=Brenneria nigrifluens DSM 30175 = ATCC 13028 TaxID=1121120 RepID=A0A2U1UR57_9GAMM|nr:MULTISPECIES: PatB family C-S lyase [Brenneria]EHD22348.1 Cystathionine beta-lyase [Brenneria sp. EniD312]PWC24168.1 putative C-S lyase [Brenneria nigrifluens] [Brenneria nigrifluens DSM 30175 = ATCC 13028]QCR05361.1 putative C-S lyase [Brenneria nigrifluens] [Brenneria nigrifluens DSM 30175 = ATCC 13028]